MDPDDVGGGSALESWIARLWTRLDDPGEWFVLADWLAERRDPRGVLLRQALGGGRLEEAGTHWARLRDVHRVNGFDDVGGLPWELSFLVAARELLRVPAVSHFEALVWLTNGLTDEQWAQVYTPLLAALAPWPDRLRNPRFMTWRQTERGTLFEVSDFVGCGSTPSWWPMVRSAELNLPMLDRPLRPTDPLLTALQCLRVTNPDIDRELETIAQLPV
ncbi:MAG: hypothetical protein AAF602_24660, partial [Myxococcota bacterium]